VISGFRRDLDDICDFLSYDAAYSGDSLPTSRKVGKELPFYPA